MRMVWDGIYVLLRGSSCPAEIALAKLVISLVSSG
jgi:hypothetical protein